MKTLLAAAALALAAGCAPMAMPPAPPAMPLTRAEIESRYLAGPGGGSALADARARGVVALTADDLVALKKAGVPDADVQAFIAARRAPPEVLDPAAAHEEMHSPWRTGPTRMCAVCGGWVRAE
jgi:hypothetical protein